MNEIVVSIPHTGTKFLMQRLDIKDQIHSHAEWCRLQKELEGKKIYSPLRHPYKVWESWTVRNNPDRAFPYITFAFGWYAMHMIDTMYDVEFINLETQEDSRITDWSAEGHAVGKGYIKTPIPTDMKKLFNLPFVKRHFKGL